MNKNFCRSVKWYLINLKKNYKVRNITLSSKKFKVKWKSIKILHILKFITVLV
ncbi:hypothetical protein [Candidatus Riesia pediculischaeffi]|uniref:Uncharacterized protein n=1 Tax=Candidatus Riesia pediculischaeffi PTSU TaxID=1401651 RepID=A0A0C1V6A9_9ENTR|nr:hypothetical protein [Candidatus Riesia pediculischaeffi]KIE63974.1 hypothetical protein P689_122143 [Candidatus Riesia pediculischaeffi PTSU]